MMKDTHSLEALSAQQLRQRLKTKDISKKIFVVPMVDLKTQVGPSSIDLRLGTDFIITKRTNYSIIDPLEAIDDIESKVIDFQEPIFVGIGKRLVLHPNQIVLGGTLEYIRLPPDIMAYVVGRSSWGRLGLVIATAILVHPGYTGIVTLELVNLGDTPIALYPGVRIAQLAFHKVTPPPPGKQDFFARMTYRLSTRPSFSKIYQDEEWEVLRKISMAERKRAKLSTQ